MKEVTLHQHEQARLHVLNSVLAEEITIGQAAALMDLSERHARRLLAAYRELGAEALAHGNRGRRPHNAVPEAVAAAVVRLAATRGNDNSIWPHRDDQFWPHLRGRDQLACAPPLADVVTRRR